MVIKIDVTRAVEEFDIAGKIYTMGMSDEDLVKYRKANVQFEKDAQELDKLNADDPNADEKAKQVIKNMYDVLLGPGAFERIYHDVGKSSLMMASIVKQVMDTIDLKYRNNTQMQAQRYVKHKNKRHTH